MNILSHVLDRINSHDDETVEATPEEQKKARIEYHRRSVRNGPVAFRAISTGQQRRQAARDRATFDRKLNQRHRRGFMAKQRETAVIRGNLQILGAMEHEPFTYEPTTQQRLRAATWIIDRYAPRTEEGELVVTDSTLAEAVQAAQADIVSRSRR